MPIHYGSQVNEHHAVRTNCGMFDVSHMLTVDVSGADATAFLGRLFAGDVNRLTSTGRSLYTLMLNESGGIIDDLIVYSVPDGYRIVFNAGMADVDLAWLQRWLNETEADVAISPRRDLSMVAVQGPNAVELVSGLLRESKITEMQSFSCMSVGDCFVARTGYTGEDGVEVIAPHDHVLQLWTELHARFVIPCGLGARDTLRIEAGLNLNGSDMDSSTTPHESALSWTVHLQPEDRAFIGRNALSSLKANPPIMKLTGVVLEESGVLRHGYDVETDEGIGIITSGTYSPTLGYSVGFARVPRQAKGPCRVRIRNREKEARLVKPPFVKHGKKVHA